MNDIQQEVRKQKRAAELSRNGSEDKDAIILRQQEQIEALEKELWESEKRLIATIAAGINEHRLILQGVIKPMQSWVDVAETRH